MSETVRKFLLAGDKLLSEIHLRPFTKTKNKYKRLKKLETKNRFIKTNKIKLVCNMTLLMKIFRIYVKEQSRIKYYVIKHLIIQTNEHQLMLMQFLKGKKKESDRELHKPIIRKLEKRQVHTLFIDNILSTDLVDMQLLNKSNK